MQTYQHIIDALTEGQRVRLLTDIRSLSDPSLAALGVPSLTVGSLASLLEREALGARAMARSWDPALVSGLTAAVCGEPSLPTCLTVPGAKAAVGAMPASLSEDPVLSGDMAGAILQGISRAGLHACMTGYTAHNGDTAVTGHVPVEPRVIEEHLTAPFRTALYAAPAEGIVAEFDTEVPASWRELNGMFILRRHASAEETVRALLRGEILLAGSASTLQSALHTHRRLCRELAHGKVTMERFNAACSAGEAISEETLGGALERLFAFAEACGHRRTAEPADARPALYARAFGEMTVLLDNSARLLPLKKQTKFCLVGAPAAACAQAPSLGALYASRQCVCLGHAAGYEAGEERSDALIPPAVGLAGGADVIILFLSAHGCARGTDGGLPANRLALFDALSRLQKKLVVVLDAADMPDLRFLKYAATPPSAILLAPLTLRDEERSVGAEYTMELLFGIRSPEGHLTATLPDPTVPVTLLDRSMVGPFRGYRFYDTVGAGTLYPFGHGLGYTHFVYRGLVVKNGQASFTVTNKGNRAGVALPQVYIGADASAVRRPRKELVAYTRVPLAPGESRYVSLPVSPRPVLTEDGMKCEAGDYTVFVGESVADIRLDCRRRFEGSLLPADPRVRTDGWPIGEHYMTEHDTLEAEYTPMKASMRNTVFGVAALIMAALIEIFGLVVAAASPLPDLLAAILAVGAIVFLILDLRDRKRQASLEQQRMEELDRVLYSDARKISVPNARELFDEVSEAAGEEVAGASVAPTSGEAYDPFADVDATLTFANAAAELCRLAVEKGLGMEEATARSLLSAMAASRLVVVRGMGDEQFHALLGVLCEYFDCPVCADRVDATYVSESAALLGGTSASEPRGLLRAVQSAQDRMRQVHISALTDVTWAGISRYFVPFASYARAPHSASHVSVQDPNGHTETHRLPPNLWFLLCLKEGETLADLPDYIADVATVHTWTLGAANPVPRLSEFRPFSYGQMLYLVEHVRQAFAPEEDVWRRIDRLEEFVGRHADFRIGNKLWIGMETYMAVLVSCGVEGPQALDETLAVKLLPAVIPALTGKIARDEQGLGETLDICLGEDAAILCRRTVKESGADVL